MKNLFLPFAVLVTLSFSSCNKGNDIDPVPPHNDRIDGEHTPGGDKNPGEDGSEINGGRTPGNGDNIGGDKDPGEDGSEINDGRTPGNGDNIDGDKDPGEDGNISVGTVKVYRDAEAKNRNTHQIVDVYSIGKNATTLNLRVGENQWINIYTTDGEQTIIKADFDITIYELLKTEGIQVNDLGSPNHWFTIDGQRKLIPTSIKVVKYIK